ncbi:MAG TPA: hypothetical protein VM715_09465 [Candidatus Acidoferrum sp.]|nr:hypothetical protein [Candidatus Acidoferrum sp.]
MRVPDAIDPAVGYRVWLVEEDRLFSFAHDYIMWQPYMPFEAVCSKDHEVPDKNCSCGLYAAATFNRLFEMGYTKSYGMFAAPEGRITVAGQVKLWGAIIPASTGWRAQFAYPQKLLVPYSRWKIARKVAAEYGVPFQLYNLERKH